MSSINYVHDGTGNTFIPSTQRPDGTWRRPIRVRDGYVPQDEQPLYVSKGKQIEKSPYPVGLSAADFVSSSQSSNNPKTSYFEIGNYEPVTKIPGLNFVKESEDEKKLSSKKKKKSKSKGIGMEIEVSSSKSIVSTLSSKEFISSSSSSKLSEKITQSTSTTDPVKRLRNLRKKLKDIEGLEFKISSGELQNPEKDQLDKIHRKDEVLEEMDELNSLIASLNLSV